MVPWFSISGSIVLYFPVSVVLVLLFYGFLVLLFFVLLFYGSLVLRCYDSLVSWFSGLIIAMSSVDES